MTVFEISQNVIVSQFLPEYMYKVMKNLSCIYSKSLVITCCILLWAGSGMCTNCLLHIYQNLIYHKKIKFIIDENHIVLLLQLLVRICGVLLWYKSCMFYDPFLWTIKKKKSILQIFPHHILQHWPKIYCLATIHHLS